MTPTQRRAKLLDRLATALDRTSVNDPLKVDGFTVERRDADSVDVLFADGHLVRIEAWAICSRCRLNRAIGPQVGATLERPICRRCHGADLTAQLDHALGGTR